MPFVPRLASPFAVPHRRPTPGPLGRAKLSQVASLRTLVTAYAAWERSQGTPGQTLSPDVPSRARSGIPMTIERRLFERTTQRLRARPDAEHIAATHRILYLRAHRPDQWHVEQNAANLEGIHRELTRIRTALEANARIDLDDVLDRTGALS